MSQLNLCSETAKHAFCSPSTQTIKLHSVSSWLLSLGLVFSVATQLRLPGLSFGLGEALLLLWLLSTLFSATNWRSPALIRVIILILVGALLLTTGYFLVPYPAGQSRPPVLHDTLAYVFCAILAINYARLADKYEYSLPVTLLRGFLFSVLLALVLGVAARDWSGVDVMYYHTRWQHLSNNPNQFALLALPIPYLALHLILRQSEQQKMLMPTLLGLLSLLLGWYSKSDALALAWLGGGLVATLALCWEHPKRLTPLLVPNSSYARRIAAFLVLLMVTGSAWQFRDIAKQIVFGASASAPAPAPAPAQYGCLGEMGIPKASSKADETQAGTRFCLWRNAIVVTRYAPLTGLGPGPHSGIVKPFEGIEAHNTLLDWGTQTGIVGAVALLTYLAWLLWKVMLSRSFEMVAMLLALYCFSMFHLTLRQPLFWFVPLVALELALRTSMCAADAKFKE